MKTIEARLLEPETDGEQLIQLFDDVFGHTVTPKMWEWKYRPPWSERHYCYVGVCEGKIIGFVGAMPLRGSIDGREVPFFQLADAMVHQKFRLRFDYFGLAAQSIRDDITKTHPEHLLYGFSDHRAFLFFLRKGMGGLVVKAWARFVEPEETAAPRKIEFRDWDWQQPEIDAIWEQRSGFRAGLIRDGTYLNWRYGGHPAFPYRLVGAYEEGQPIGWAVIGSTKSAKKQRKALPIVDMMLPEARTEEALQALSEHLETTIKTWLPLHHAPGFPDRKESGTHVYHFVKDSVVTTDYLRDNLYYTMGDVDWW